jgi:hypothetical protein
MCYLPGHTWRRPDTTVMEVTAAEAGPRSVRTRSALSVEEGAGAAIVAMQGDALGTGERGSGSSDKGVPTAGCEADLTSGDRADGTLGTASLGSVVIERRPEHRQWRQPPRGRLRCFWRHQLVRR